MAKVTYSIQDGTKYDDFKLGFLRAVPVPIDPVTKAPIMSESAWIKEWGKRQFFDKYKSGKSMIANEMAVIDDEVIE